MNNKIFVSVLIIIFCLSIGLFAQDEGASNDTTSADGNQVDEVIDWAWKGKFYPYVEVTAGLAQLKHEKFEGKLPEVGLV